ncbi:MAG: Hsp20/alpha crystallin family protein [Verrucomicrobiaceae bacterium]|jgi:HSP20 family protein|nr:Hsp20/alpha crystallin family protein [Verrucomicrobiaceae bacterium]
MNNTCTNPQNTIAAPAVESRPARRPRYQIENSPEAHTVKIELPGVVKEAVQLNLDDSILHLSAQRANTVPETWKPLHRELSDIGYELRLKLNDRVDEAGLTANLADGILTVVLPVKEAAKPRSITVQ